MKKVLNVFVILLVLFGLAACSNPIGGETSVNEVVQLGECKLKATEQGIEISVPDTLPKGVKRLVVDRKPMRVDGEFDRIYMHTWDINKKTLVDYFVNKDEEYMYELELFGENDKVLAVSSLTTIKAVGGSDELDIKPIKINFNKETGKMTFTDIETSEKKMPEFKNKVVTKEVKLNGCSVIYRDENKNFACNAELNHAKCEIDMASTLWEDDSFEKNLNLYCLRTWGECENVGYGQDIIANTSLNDIKTINIKDTRPVLNLESDINGIKIVFPAGIEKAKIVNITRYSSTDNFSNEDENIDIRNFNPQNIKEITDYFVESGKEYKYKAVFRGDNWNDVVLQTKLTPITANKETKNKELGIDKTTISYNNETGIMSFSPIEKTVDVNGKKENLRISMAYDDPTVQDFNWVWCSIPEGEKNEMNWTTAHRNGGNESFYKRNLTLGLFDIEVEINNVLYRKRYKKDEITSRFENIPDPLVIPDTRVIIDVISNEKGIEIKLPAAPEGAEYFTIGRQNVNDSTNNTDMLYWYIRSEDLTKNSVVDYFVTPGQTYEYTLYYRYAVPGEGGIILKKSTPMQFTAVNGMKEIFLDPDTKVSYNKDTGIMSLNPIPNYSAIRQLMGNNDNLNANVYYRTQNRENIWGNIKEDGTINWAERLSDYKNGIYLEKTLTLDSFNMDINLAGISYNKWFYKDELMNKIPTIPETITVPDNRAKLTLTPTAGGIIITLPEDLKGATECNIYRKKMNSDEWYNINIPELSNKKITDYFVDNGVEYEYSASFSKFLGEGKGWETVFRTITSSVTATGGKGDIKITNNPRATYDETTSVMTFTTIPEITSAVSGFIGSNNKNWSNLQISYGIKNSNGGLYNIIDFNIKESMNLAGNIGEWNKELLGEDLTLSCISFNANINNVKYSKGFKSDSYDLPKNIKINDTRAILKLTPTAEGIEITFPVGIERAKRVNITRYSSADNFSKEDENIEIWDLDKKEIKKITDYFVESGKEYKYIAVFRGDNWDDVVLQTKLTPVTAKNGCTGELKSTTTPTATYDPGTGIMNFSTKPVWPTSVSELVSNKSTVTNWENYSRFIIVYNLPNWGRVVNAEILNTINLFADVSNIEEIQGKELTLSGINAEVQINGIKYSKLLPGTGLTEKVIVVDTRPDITAISNENGIEIKLPAAVPEGTEYFTIGRQNVNNPTDSGDMLYWYIRSEDLTKKSVVDYFVTPGQKYEYTVYYGTNNNGNIIGKSKSVQFTAENGMNESFLYPSTTFSYNKDTGIMTLSPVPDTLKINGLLKEGDSFEPKLWYRLQDNSNSIWGKPDINGKIDWVSQVGIYENGKYLKTNLELQNFQIEANISNVKYKSRLSRDDLNIIFPTIPTSIFVPDTRAQLKLTPITDGIEIEFPKELQEASSCTIYRRLAGSDSNWDYIDIPKEIFSSKIQEGIIDYFVCSNKKYEYYAIFKKFIGGDKGWEPVLRTKTSIVNADNGKGEIEIINSPKADYNQTTAMMNFTELPQLTSTVMDFITTNNYHSELKIVYQKEKSNFNWDNFFEFQIGKSINLSEIVSGIEDEICNQNLTLSGIEGSVYINGVLYYKEFITKTSGLPAEIVIPDNRTTLTLTPTTDGIKIDFPKDLKNATSCTIFRRLAGSNSNWDMIFIKQNFSNKTGIIDKFVENGKNYEYYATFHKYNTGNIGTEIVLNTKISSTGAAGGRGEIGLNNPTELNGSYDNNGIMKLDPIPCIKPTLVNNKSWKFGIGYTNPSGQWQCAFMDNETGIIDYKTSYNKDSSKSHVGKKLKISSIRIIVDTGDLHYQIENFPNVSLANLPQEIFVTEENLIQ